MTAADDGHRCWYPKGSTSTAARSFSNAPWVMINSGDSTAGWRRLPRRRLIRGQLDRRQGVGVAVDTIALGGLQRRDPADLERNAESRSSFLSRSNIQENASNARAVE